MKKLSKKAKSKHTIDEEALQYLLDAGAKI